MKSNLIDFALFARTSYKVIQTKADLITWIIFTIIHWSLSEKGLRTKQNVPNQILCRTVDLNRWPLQEMEVCSDSKWSAQPLQNRPDGDTLKLGNALFHHSESIAIKICSQSSCKRPFIARGHPGQQGERREITKWNLVTVFIWKLDLYENSIYIYAYKNQISIY